MSLKRLTTKDFDIVFQKGKVSKEGLFLMKKLDGTPQGPFTGVAVSKKKLKKATDRNIVKRHIREVFRKLEKKLDSNSSYIVIYGGTEVPNYSDVYTSIKKLI